MMLQRARQAGRVHLFEVVVIREPDVLGVRGVRDESLHSVPGPPQWRAATGQVAAVVMESLEVHTRLGTV